MFKHNYLPIVAVGVAAVTGTVASSQQYPVKPNRMVIPFSTGSASDD